MSDDAVTAVSNDNLILVVGESAAGKSVSLKGLRNPEGVSYANCESGKKLPFKSGFKEFVITDPYQVYTMFDWLENEKRKDKYHTAVVDTVNFMMDMYESVHVVGSKNTMGAWGDYGQFFRNLMQQKVASSTKNVIMLAHVIGSLNEELGYMEYTTPMKGALKGKVEAFFSQIIGARRVPLRTLEGFENPLLTITPRDEQLGFKHVFQTQLTKETVGWRIRGPMDMWSYEETFINNDVQLVLDRTHEYYGTTPN
jgi:hypothetical protein